MPGPPLGDVGTEWPARPLAALASFLCLHAKNESSSSPVNREWLSSWKRTSLSAPRFVRAPPRALSMSRPA